MGKEENNKEQVEEVKITSGFFKKVYKSITDFEQYPELAAQGTGTAIKYLAKLVLLFTILILAGMLFQFRLELNEIVQKFDQAVPDLTYSNGILDVKSDNTITIDNGAEGKVIIDTKTQDAQKIAEYEKQDQNSDNRIILLNDRVIIVSSANRTMTYTYSEILNKIPNSSLNLDNCNKQDFLNYLNSEGKYIIYLFFALVMLIGIFLIYFITIFFDSLTIAILGYVTSIFVNLKIRFVAIFNMSIYALTLSVILNAIYTIIKIFVDFEIQYFDVAYIAIAYIYIAAAIFLLKANFIKRQAELMKIMQEQDKIKVEIEEKERKKEEKDKKEDEKKEEKKGDSKKEGKKDNNLDDSPEGSKA